MSRRPCHSRQPTADASVSTDDKRRVTRSFCDQTSNTETWRLEPKLETSLMAMIAVLVLVLTGVAGKPQPHFQDHSKNFRQRGLGTFSTAELYSNIEDNDCSQVPPPTLSQFIVGGSEVSPPYKYPWMAKLTHSSGDHYCGGSLIKYKNGAHKILTAAHCLQGATVNSVHVELGTHLRFGGDETSRKVYDVSRMRIHEHYNYETLENDVALLELRQPVEERAEVKPICLETQPYVPGQELIVIGWGFTTENGTRSDALQEVKKPIRSEATCRSWLGSNYFHFNSMLCAGTEDGGRDSCNSDSGGPAFVFRDGKYRQAGVVSWGIGCGQPMQPGVYAYVYGVRDWISHQLF